MAGGAPDSWYWAHDIAPDQVASVVTEGMSLVRLSAYGSGDRRRFAALVYVQPTPRRTYLLDLDGAALAEGLRQAPGRPVAVTVADGVPPRFSVVLDAEPGPESVLHLDLDEAAAMALLDGAHGIVDFAAYGAGDGLRYAVVTEERPGESWLLTGLSAGDLDAGLAELGAVPVRVRECGRDRVAAGAEPAVAERSRRGDRERYRGLGADGVARRLDDNDAYPIDLDATKDERGIRFTVVMGRDR